MKRTNNKRLATPQSVDQVVWSICDIMRRGNCAGAMQYVPELTWILFLRILDEQESREQQEAEALGIPFRPSLEAPYRWRDWAAPPPPSNHQGTKTQSEDQNPVSSWLGGEPSPGWKRAEWQNAAPGALFSFVNTELLPQLKVL